MSYNTLAEAQIVDGALTQAQLDDAQIYLDARYLWPGKIESITQPNNWPRLSSTGGVVLDANGRELIGTPDQVKRAEIEAAVLIKDNQSLLATTVATASSVSATVGGQLTEKTSKAGSVTTTRKYSAASSESSTGNTAQELDENGFPIIQLIDAILAPIINAAKKTTSSSVHRRYRS